MLQSGLKQNLFICSFDSYLLISTCKSRRDVSFIFLHLFTSFYIILYHSISFYVSLHHSTSLYIILHHSTSFYIILHLSTSFYISLHLSTSSYIYDFIFHIFIMEFLSGNNTIIINCINTMTHFHDIVNVENQLVKL